MLFMNVDDAALEPNANMKAYIHLGADGMPGEQLNSFLEFIKRDTTLQERLKTVADLDTVVAIANEAGFAISKDQMLKAQAEQHLGLSDEELQQIAGGGGCEGLTWADPNTYSPYSGLNYCT